MKLKTGKLILVFAVVAAMSLSLFYIFRGSADKNTSLIGDGLTATTAASEPATQVSGQQTAEPTPSGSSGQDNSPASSEPAAPETQQQTAEPTSSGSSGQDNSPASSEPAAPETQLNTAEPAPSGSSGQDNSPASSEPAAPETQQQTAEPTSSGSGKNTSGAASEPAKPETQQQTGVPVPVIEAGPRFAELSDEGFSILVPSSDSRLIYVSSSTGDDSNDGLSEDTPLKTIKAAVKLVRNGYPDWILLKRGDVWKDESVDRFISGRSKDEPAVITYYGTDGDRPVIKISKNFIDHDGDIKNYLAIVGLNFINYKMDPSDPEFKNYNTIANLRFVGGGSYILIEDCKLQHVELIVEGFNSTYRNISIRRNIIVDAYWRGSTTSNSYRPSGLYAAQVDGLLIEENVFDHNGWNDQFENSQANMFNHNIYLQYTNVGNRVVVRGNIVTRGSSHGIQGRPGGLYEDNLLVQNAVSLGLGYSEHPLEKGTYAIARNNVILEGRTMAPPDVLYPRTAAVWGLYPDQIGDGTVILENNIVANVSELGSNDGIRSLKGVIYKDNIQYTWGGGIGDMDDPDWPDPERSVGSYHGTLGKEATLEAFLDVVRNRKVGEWLEEYSAYAVNAYIRKGFNR